MADEELRRLLARVRDLLIDHDYERSDELRDFINQHRDVPEFSRLAMTLILLAEAGL